MSVVTFGPYELQGLLGRGGMGEVHRAFDRDQSRVVALKLLPLQLGADDGFVERFRRESYAAAQLNDPHVIPIHRYGEIDGRLYIDMRLVSGLDLAKLLARDGPLSVARTAWILGQAAEALDAAHAENLVHRDVKPSNLLVTPQDFVYLVDFGIAHVIGRQTHGAALTATGATIGTLDYMAPERFGGGDVDARADVYSLACVLYEVLTGRRPFPLDGAPALIHAHLSVDPPRATAVRPGLPSALDDVIARGMAKDPAARYRSAGDLAAAVAAVRDLGAAATPVTVTGPSPPAPTELRAPVPPPPRTSPQPGPGRSRPWGWVAAAAGLAVAALLAGVLLGRGEPGPATAPSAVPTREVAAAATPPPATPPAVTPPAATSAARPAGDLGLPAPISSPACDGRFVVFVGSSVTPGRHPAEVARLLAGHPGSSYLLAEASCSSLRARLPDGRSIYSVYLGPFGTVADACRARARAGGDSYLRVLDDVSPDGRSFAC